MPDYKAMYFRLAGKIADAIDTLVVAQRETEEMAMKDGTIIKLVDNETEDNENSLEG